MAVWRCPHCATPQPEASRCWVCRRSTTSCASCRHFRKAVAGGLGMCGLDPRRTALTGAEIRPCWVAATPTPPGPDVPVAWAVGSGDDGAADGPGGRPHRTFVPVEPSPARSTAATALAVVVAAAPQTAGGGAALTEAPAVRTTAPPRPVPGRWWLWGDPEPWPED